MKKAAIPALQGVDVRMAQYLGPMKENLEQIQGLRGGRISSLPTTATTAEIIDKINEVLTRLQT